MHIRKILKFGNVKVSILVISWRWSYGICSKIRDSDEHYLLFDIDTDRWDDFLVWAYAEGLDEYPNLLYRTRHGVHCIVLRRGSFADTASTLLSAPCVDKIWVSIGLKRGYWFLKPTVKLPEAFKVMSFMKIQDVI